MRWMALRFRQFLFLAGVFVVVLLPAGAYRTAAVGQDEPARESLAREAWAEALLTVFCDGNEEEQSRAMEQYSQALGLSGPDQAAVLVSLGDWVHPPSLPSLPSRLRDTVYGIAREAGPEARAFVDKLEAEAGAFWSSRDSVLCYCAASAADPMSAQVWLRLALEGVSEAERFRSDSVLAKLREADPGNALAYYLSAREACGRDRPEQALDMVLRGLNRKHCTTYEPPYPQGVSIRYPAAEPFMGASVSGIRVPQSALLYAADLRESWWATFLREDLRHLWRALREEGARLRQQGKTEEADRYCVASMRLGLDFMRCRPASALNAFTGIAMYMDTADELLAAYQGREPEKAEALRQYNTKVRSAAQALRELVGYDCGEGEMDYEERDRAETQAVLRGEHTLSEERGAIMDVIESLPPLPMCIAEVTALESQ